MKSIKHAFIIRSIIDIIRYYNTLSQGFAIAINNLY